MAASEADEFELVVVEEEKEASSVAVQADPTLSLPSPM